MSKRTKYLLGIGVIAALVIGWQVAAFAVHDDVFQLEGNAVTTGDPSPPPDDWENVVGPDGDGGLSTATAFDDELDPQTTFFTGGGSKDPNAISQWQWKDDAGGIPDKTNLTNSYAASYTGTTGDSLGDKLLYFGADRFDGSGDAAIAFWFVQDPVDTVDPVPPANGTFSGAHRNDDVLVISNFSNGGVVPTITVYKWDTTCTKAANNNPQATQCGAANLRVVAVQGGAGTNADCANPNPDNACAIVNSDTEDAPWAFTDKDGNTDFAPGEFFEGGINLTALGLGNTCFSTALAETRTSTSPTSTLKDFTLSSFGKCGSGTVSTPQKVNADGTTSDIAGPLSIGTGSVQVADKATVTVTGGAPTWSGTMSFFLCGPLATATPPDPATDPTCTTGGTTINDGPTGANAAKPVTSANPTATSSFATVTSAGRYCWRAVFSGDSANAVDGSTDATSGECFTVTPVTPALDTQAVASPVDFGQPVRDNATLAGTANQPGTPVINPTTAGAAAGGTITFTLYKADCTTLATGTGTNPQTVNVSGNGTYPTPPGSVSFTPDAPGTYHWKAQYTPATGDPNNIGSTHNGSCTDTDETVIVNQQNTTIDSTQRWVPNDTATLNHGPAGTQVRFTLLKDVSQTDCQNNTYAAGDPAVIYTEQRSVVENQGVFTATSNNTTPVTSVDDGGDEYRWKIEVPAVGAFKAATSCVETTAFTSLINGGTVTSP